jgi:hypothetical protein
MAFDLAAFLCAVQTDDAKRRVAQHVGEAGNLEMVGLHFIGAQLFDKNQEHISPEGMPAAKEAGEEGRLLLPDRDAIENLITRILTVFGTQIGQHVDTPGV